MDARPQSKFNIKGKEADKKPKRYLLMSKSE